VTFGRRRSNPYRRTSRWNGPGLALLASTVSLIFFEVMVAIMIVALLFGSFVAEAQSGKIPRVGVLLYAPTAGQSNPSLDAFRSGLRELDTLREET
jgi:hypothetical protein